MKGLIFGLVFLVLLIAVSVGAVVCFQPEKEQTGKDWNKIPKCPRCNKVQPPPDSWGPEVETRWKLIPEPPPPGMSGLFWCEWCKETHRVEMKK